MARQCRHVVNITAPEFDLRTRQIPPLPASVTKGGLNSATTGPSNQLSSRGIRVTRMRGIGQHPSTPPETPDPGELHPLETADGSGPRRRGGNFTNCGTRDRGFCTATAAKQWSLTRTVLPKIASSSDSANAIENRENIIFLSPPPETLHDLTTKPARDFIQRLGIRSRHRFQPGWPAVL